MAQSNGKTSKATKPPTRGTRRERRSLGELVQTAISRAVLSPAVGWGLVIVIATAIAAGSLAAWAREQPLVAINRVMSETRNSRLEFTLEDTEATRRAIEAARQNTPRRFSANAPAINDIRESLLRLPAAMSGVESLEGVSPQLAQQFGITSQERFDALRELGSPELGDRWRQRVEGLMDILSRRPLLDAAGWQRATQDGLSSRLILTNSGIEQTIDRVGMPIGLNEEATRITELNTIVRIAGFAPRDAAMTPRGSIVLERLLQQREPTFIFDAEGSLAAQDAAAAMVPKSLTIIANGQTIYRRGDVLTAAQLYLLDAEMSEFVRSAPWWMVWLRRLSIVGACASVGAILGGYVVLFGERIAQRVARMAWLAVLLIGALAGACMVAVLDPRFITLSATAPTLLVAFLVVIAYDRRRALAISALHGLLVCIALDQPIGQMAVVLVGIGAAVWQLRDVRHRRRIVHTSVIAGAALAVGTLGISLIDRPLSEASLWQMLTDSAWSAFAGPLVGGIALFILPTVERLFGITTGMTLTELRDPRHPLLRLVQQRAPGTYSHSLNVASIAESAADAIGADSLLTYVGCLYHDIGKMNKPQYFVENQSPGRNKHDRLSPAMSLLVIIGHVKDGLAMSREYGLPKQLDPFIAEHHGTTLVEYFFKLAAKKAREAEAQASEAAASPSVPGAPVAAGSTAAATPPGTPAGKKPEATGSVSTDKPGTQANAPASGTTKPEPASETRQPEMIDYRYPGPKPQSRETAIVMLADCSESAVRAMSEPTAGRIDALVRELARKRLLDGQFDECDVTLVELGKVTESISKTLTSIYHSRISYDVDKAKAKPAGRDDLKAPDVPTERRA